MNPEYKKVAIRPRFTLYRIGLDGRVSRVDTSNEIYHRDNVADQYLYDAPEGERYFVIDSLDGMVCGQWKVQTAKTLVAQ